MPIVTRPPRTALSRTILSFSSRSRPRSRPSTLHYAAPTSSSPRAHPFHTLPLDLTNHRVLVTGGSRGIGKAIAARFASLGASTTIIGRNADTLQTAVREIASHSPHQLSDPLSWRPGHCYVVGDVSSKGFWELASRSLVMSHHHRPLRSPSPSLPPPDDDTFGQTKFVPTLTILVNAAGVTHNALLTRQSAVATEDVVQTNLMGTVWACKLMGKELMRSAARARARARGGATEKGEEEKSTTAAPSTEEEGRGGALNGGVSIVNVSSLLAVQGGVGSAAYAASKAGVLGLTRALAGEMGPLGVRVNAIVPGYVETDMTAAMQVAAREKALERIPLKRFGTVEEIAEAAVFLATNQFANNCVINLDGGMSAI